MQSFCRICIQQIFDTSSSSPLDHKSHKHRLIFCIPEVDLRAFPDAKLCNECIASLNVTYNFKMNCREMEDPINKQQFNEHSMVAQDNRLDNNTHSICRTCLEDILDNSFHLAEKLLYKSKLILCVPEMDLQVISDINLCSNCHITLDKIYIFKTKCLDIEKKIKEYLKLHDKINFRDMWMWCNEIVKFEAIDLQDDTIKQEEIELVNEDEIMEDVKEQIDNATLSLKIEELETSKYQNCKCSSSCSNVEHLCTGSKNNPEHLKYDYNTIQKRNLLDGIHQHTTEKLFKCSLCDYRATEKSSLKKHICTHTGEKPFSCLLCGYSTAQKSCFKNHIRTHTGVKPFNCSLCEYSCIEKSSLTKHIKHIHSGERPFKCSLCDYSCVEQSNLTKHIKHIHSSEELFKCSLCEYSCIEKSNLTKHITCTHTDEKPFNCSLCGYSATQKSRFKNHIRIHTGVKPYKCSLCEYSCIEKSSLTKHIMRTHTGEKPFKCSQCTYSAVEKSSLVRHIRIHTGEKPFKCSLCKYRATQKFHLKRHMHIHSGENS